MNQLEKHYISTKEVKTILQVRGCDVMHFRESGKLQFTKKGNAFWYLRSDVEKLEKTISPYQQHRVSDR